MPQDTLRVLMVASEAAPFAKSGGLADVLGALPAALQRNGVETAVVIPRYESVDLTHARRIYDELHIHLGPSHFTVSIWEQVRDGVPYWFVDYPYLFQRSGLYGTKQGDYSDNHLRFGTLCKAALGISRFIWPCDVIHGHDWQAGLVGPYLRYDAQYHPAFLGMRSVFSIHNMGYQGNFHSSVAGALGFDGWMNSDDAAGFYGAFSFMKAGLVFADMITTVSPRYAWEIQTPDGGFKMDGILRYRSQRLVGILNGVDYSDWNPETDHYLPAPYSADDLAGKRKSKEALLDMAGISRDRMDKPLLGIVSRFAWQKGYDLFAEIGESVVRDQDVTVIALGSGEKNIEDYFRWLASSYPDRVAIKTGYDIGLSHLIEAGADMFLMPSRYEPCGLNQIYSLRYGTVPIVRAVGGLDDTIEESTGFKFHDFTGHALWWTIRAAVDAYYDKPRWEAMMKAGMDKNFSWDVSAQQYKSVYNRVLGRQA